MNVITSSNSLDTPLSTPVDLQETTECRSVQQRSAPLASMLSSWTTTPAYVVDRNHDLIAVNELGQLFIPIPCKAGQNMIEAVADQAALETEDERHGAWERTIAQMTAALRFHSSPSDPRLELLVTSLSSRSRAFRQVWASHEARPLREGSAPVRIDPFGFITFQWQTCRRRSKMRPLRRSKTGPPVCRFVSLPDPGF